MAVDVYSEVFSPRISFSYDLKESDVITPVHHQSHPLISTVDFDFCITTDQLFSQQISSADELFANGKILPVEVKKSVPLKISSIGTTVRVTRQTSLGAHRSTDIEVLDSADELFDILPVKVNKYTPPFQNSITNSSSTDTSAGVTRQVSCTVHCTNVNARRTAGVTRQVSCTVHCTNVDARRKMLKELLVSANSEEEKPMVKTFWQFRRSNSLNGENSRSNGLIRSLQFLSRSNSTGSDQNRKPCAPPRPIQRHNSKKEPSIRRTTSSSCSRNDHNHPLASPKRNTSSPLKKSGSVRTYGSTRISPVLNISPTYISKATLFGLGSLFCNSKSKKKKK